jgi:hypothetical protein
MHDTPLVLALDHTLSYSIRQYRRLQDYTSSTSTLRHTLVNILTQLNKSNCTHSSTQNKNRSTSQHSEQKKISQLQL